MLFGKLKGAYSLPDDPAVRLPDNKTLQFPLQLFVHPYYRSLYEGTKQAFLNKYPTGVNLLLNKLAVKACEQMWQTPIRSLLR